MKMPMAEAAEFAAQLQDATRTSEADMLSLMDTIQRTFYLGVNSGNMLQGFAKLSPAMDTIRMKGIEGANALAPLLVMANQAGMAGESAGNAYRQVLQVSLDANKVSKVNAELTKHKIKLDFTNGKGEFGGLNKLFAQLEKLKKLSTQDRLGTINKLFGDNSETLQVVSLLIDKGAAGYADVQAKMANQASLQQRVNKQLGTLQNLWDAASGTFTNALVVFGEAIAPELKAVTEWLGKLAEQTGAWAKAHPQLTSGLMKCAAVLAVTLTVLGGLALAFAAVLGPLAMVRLSVGLLGMKLGGLGSGLMKLPAVGRVVFGGLVSGFKLLGAAAGWLGGALMKLLTVARVVFVFLLANPVVALAVALATLALTIWANWGALGPMFAALWAGIKSSAGACWDWISAKVGGVAQTIYALYLQWSPVRLIYRHWDDIKAFMSNLPSQFMTIGGQIIDGLINGISAKWGVLKDKFASLGDALPGWLRTKLDIHSPSRVFAQIGQYTMQGLDVGIDKGQQGPLDRMLALTKQLTTPVAAALSLGSPVMANATPVKIDSRPPLSRPAASAQAAPAPINITINAAPGMDERKLAQLVAQEIARQQRSAQAANRSRLADRD
ncbi:phage tail tape measure protein [Chitinimonas sp. BJB300]|nr:phage tail tape measure protein [Chitinimonas sp. BJB300]